MKDWSSALEVLTECGTRDVVITKEGDVHESTKRLNSSGVFSGRKQCDFVVDL